MGGGSTMLESKVGQIYSYSTEQEMLRVANKLEEEGFKVKRYYVEESFYPYKCECIRYKD